MIAKICQENNTNNNNNTESKNQFKNETMMAVDLIIGHSEQP